MTKEQLDSVRKMLDGRAVAYPQGDDIIILGLLQHIDEQEQRFGKQSAGKVENKQHDNP